jgi:DNA-binding NarL/FixJ family response regulator
MSCFVKATAVAIIATLVVACSSKGGPQVTSQVVGPAGGSVTTPGGASIDIPPGALPDGVTITVTTTTNAPASSDATPVGETYRFGPEGQQFALPVAVTLPWSVARLPAGRTSADVVVFTAPAGTAEFTSLGASSADATTVSAMTTHFSDFVAGVTVADGGTPQPDGGLVQVDAAGQHDAPGPSDGAAPQPDGPHAQTDAAAQTDAPAPIDAAAQIMCYYTVSGQWAPDGGSPPAGGNTCQWTSSCDGHTYAATCSDSLCTCTIDGTQSALTRRLLLDRLIAEGPLETATLTAVLEALPAAALVATADGLVEHSNARAQSHLRGAAGAEFRQALAAALRGELTPDWAWDIVPVTAPGPRRSFVLARPTAVAAAPALAARAQAWGLTARQREILALVARGRSNKEIGRELACAENTVEYHVTAIMRRAGVRRRTELAARCWSDGATR